MSDQLEYYLSAWNLSDPQPLAETRTSKVYTVIHQGERVVLKLLKPYGWEETRGAIALRLWDGHGAVKLLNESENAHLLEYVPGDDLTSMVKAGDDSGATRIIAQILNDLYAAAPHLVPLELPPLSEWFGALFERALRQPESVYARGAHVAQLLLAAPRDECVLHGDIHHWNIRHHPDRGWLAFDPKGLRGERTYDAANTLCNPDAMPELVFNEARLLTQAGILAENTGIERMRLLKYTFAYVCLSASWSLMDHNEAAAENTLRLAALIEPHLTS